MTTSDNKIENNSVPKRRSTLERAIAIFLFLSQDQQPKSKSDFRGIGIDSTNIPRWVDLIQFIQSMPPLHLEWNNDSISKIHLLPSDSAYLTLIQDYCTRLGISPRDEYK